MMIYVTGSPVVLTFLAFVLTAGQPAGPAPSTQGASAPTAPTQRTKVAVLELSGLGITDITKNLEQYLRNSIATIDGFSMLSAVDVQMVLQDPKNQAVSSCIGGMKCAVKIGKLVGADVVVLGSISNFGDAFSLSLRAIDVKRGKELARHRANVAGRDKLIPEIRLAAYRLIAPERIRGWLIIDTTLAGIEIEIDGKSVGTTPFSKPLDNLAPGRHVVIAKQASFAPWREEFEIRPFEPTRLRIALDKKAP